MLQAIKDVLVIISLLRLNDMCVVIYPNSPRYKLSDGF